jgi:branched-subunit amino acid transport protein
LGLDFSIVATFVALIAPLVRNLPTVVCVAVSLFCSVLFSYWHWETALVAAGLLGMAAGLHLSEILRRPRMIWLLIFAMGAVVFLNRYAFLEPRLPLRLSSNARQFLGFAVPGMLTAICGPIIFLPGHQLDLSLLNPYLLGSLVAITLVLLTRSVLLSMLVSMLIFFLLRSWLA